MAGLIAVLISVGQGAVQLSSNAASFARVSPAVGAWITTAGFALLLLDALTRLRPGPMLRLGLLSCAILLTSLLMIGGAWDRISIMQEYGNRSTLFWTEGQRHLVLAFGSFVAALLAGIPLGIACHRIRNLRAPVIDLLTMIQTIPSIALFGMLILPLGWLAQNVDFAKALGISGIGTAPAMIALFLYALLPVVGNTAAGLDTVSSHVIEAADGTGFSRWGRLWKIELPLAMPVILTGARIVLVQNIGLATVCALIGAGGFGSFVFQGLGQTAPDLILLGALPTVALAFAASTIFGALIDLSKRGSDD
ncbi:ABC transporter permease [Falsirhodobacter sp. alg1]|uniref:ABC transporter permease n=1 Tax=Falsirhodobacter sp. alg1 TaxID=1472418 RepID=UPI001EDB151B|nr:ABC transporter permease [Falsirhodobacter sp. alg1]